ncbi:hypothetical protein LX99_02277 [Mucilaginibacter oryzae]|uniref:DUF4175 family protein n=1 Tax=Mucilaginibacter oryzae TaxID=468058 RepID=A0A316HE37_9SPHI|nr:DUF4175 family protein [Mucilaginibacter oryzae]PWK78433.1 hypothetical protein LX99_02277 [Mucilaginibacter oryzae]
MDKRGTVYRHIGQIRRFYICCRLVACLLYSLSAAVVLGALLLIFLNAWLTWTVAILFIVFICQLLYQKSWSTNEAGILNFLNQHYPELQESGNLLLKNPDELNLLERLQLSKVEENLINIPIRQKHFWKPVKQAGIVLAAALVVGALLATLVHLKPGLNLPGNEQAAVKAGKTVEKLLPQINAVKITITPPAYTRKVKRTQDKLTIEAEEGSAIAWEVSTNTPVKHVALLINNNRIINLKPIDNDKQTWKVQATINQAVFYQVSIGDKLSERCAIQIIHDLPPVIHIQAPQPYTYIDAGEAQQVNIRAGINDDYGIADAMIFATVAKGSGEAVKFKDYKLDAGLSFGSRLPHYDLQKLIKLPALNMEPGDELYFYIQATDTHQQQSRTDVYTVSIQDTAKLLSMDGIVTGTDQKPEFFRSERQIILDSERLLKEKDSITAVQFKNRSNDLATDQKLLRLRYGKFLGEESESDIGGDDNNAVSDLNNFGNADVIRDQYTDKHDNAEDAGFFDPAQKAQLKATLTEMWKAELQLRLYKPQYALAFEYKALRLLKDLQQKSRVYVAKTGYNPTPLKLEKRLSGDLSAIKSASIKQEIKPKEDELESLRRAAEVLSQLKADTPVNIQQQQILNPVNRQLSAKAARSPGSYLSALNALNSILSPNRKIKQSDIILVQKAIQKALHEVSKTPVAGQNSPDMGLSEQYFKNLNRSRQ